MIKPKFPALLILIPIVAVVALARMAFAHVYAALAVVTPVFVALLVMLFMYALRPRLARRGETLVYSDWLGRRHAVRLGDIYSAALVHVPDIGRYVIWRLILGRRDGAPLEITLGELYWDIDEIARFLAASGIRLALYGPAARQQVRDTIPGAYSKWPDRHPVQKNVLAFVGGLVLFVVIVGLLFLLTS